MVVDVEDAGIHEFDEYIYMPGRRICKVAFDAPEGEDAAFVTIQFVDANGTADLHAKHTLKVELEGAGILEAVGSANPCSEERYDTPESETFDGCCMAVIRAGEAAGEIHLTVTADDSVQKQLTILIQEAEG